MIDGLDLTHIPADAIHRLHREIVEVLCDTASEAQLVIADAAWIGKRLDVRQDYLDLIKTSYNAELRRVEFNPKLRKKGEIGAAEQINDWIEEKSHGAIRGTVRDDKPKDSLTKDSLKTRMILTDLIYFLGSWSNPFDSSRTKPDKFVTGEGKEIEPRTMIHGTSKVFQYIRNDFYEGVDMPFRNGTGTRLSMTLLMP